VRLLGDAGGGESVGPELELPVRDDRVHSPGSSCGEFHDANLADVESTYLGDVRENYWDRAAKLFCPWGGANFLRDIQDASGRSLTSTEMADRLTALGGPDPSYVANP
jgi:hypothetical protein